MEQAALLLIRTEALVLLADLSFFDCSWQEAKKLLDREVPRVALVLAADCPDETLWIDVLEHGVYDLVSRPFLLEELRRVLENANAHARYLPRGQHGRVAGAA